MKKSILYQAVFIIVLFMLSCSFPNKLGVIYYNKAWIKVPDKENAKYFRIQKMETNPSGKVLYTVKDYYIKDSTLQMTGSYLNNLRNKNGLFTYYFRNGKKKEEGMFLQNRKQSEFKFWYPSGKIRSVNTYDNDSLTSYKSYYENDSLHVIVDSYKNGRINGYLKSYYPNGKLLRIETYENGRFITGQCFSVSGGDTAFYPHHISAAFPGGPSALTNLLMNRQNIPINYNSITNKVSFKTVFIRVGAKIDEQGNFVEPSIIQPGKKQEYDEKAISLLSNMPKWLPAKRDGIVCEESVTINVPVVF